MQSARRLFDWYSSLQLKLKQTATTAPLPIGFIILRLLPLQSINNRKGKLSWISPFLFGSRPNAQACRVAFLQPRLLIA